MKNQALIGFICLAIIFLVAGCKKSSNPSSASPFTGNYYGSMTSQSGQGSTYLDTLKVTSTSSTQISIFDTQDSVYLTCVVSGNNITSLSGTIPPLTNTMTAMTLTGQGALSGNTLTVKAYGAYTYLGNNTPMVDTFSFTGVK